MYWTMLYVAGPISAVYLVRVALETKMADAQVEYKRVDLQSYGKTLAFRSCNAG